MKTFLVALVVLALFVVAALTMAHMVTDLVSGILDTLFAGITSAFILKLPITRLYVDGINFGGTLVIDRLAIRWGSHRFTLGKGHYLQWYGADKWHYFL